MHHNVHPCTFKYFVVDENKLLNLYRQGHQQTFSQPVGLKNRHLYHVKVAAITVLNYTIKNINLPFMHTERFGYLFLK